MGAVRLCCFQQNLVHAGLFLYRHGPVQAEFRETLPAKGRLPGMTLRLQYRLQYHEVRAKRGRALQFLAVVTGGCNHTGIWPGAILQQLCGLQVYAIRTRVPGHSRIPADPHPRTMALDRGNNSSGKLCQFRERQAAFPHLEQAHVVRSG